MVDNPTIQRISGSCCRRSCRVVQLLGGKIHRKKKCREPAEDLCATKQLKLINAQLNDFYAPLLSLTRASNILVIAFAKEQKRSHHSFFDLDDGDHQSIPTLENLLSWKRAMKETFLPMNDQREKLVVERAALILGDIFPLQLSQMLAHTREFRSVMASWKDQTSQQTWQAFVQHGKYAFRPSIPFPAKELLAYAEESYKKLIDRKQQLQDELGISEFPESPPLNYAS